MTGLCASSPDFDVVIIAGDLLDIASNVDGRAQTVVVLKYLERLKGTTRLFVCSGNHDLDSHNADGERVAKWFAKIRNLGIAADGVSLDVRPVRAQTISVQMEAAIGIP
jgi:predicted MPP superfamily phosphohydrolase